MKFNPILITILFSITICAQIQSGKVTYVASMTPISDKKIDSLFHKMSEIVFSFHKNKISDFLKNKMFHLRIPIYGDKKLKISPFIVRRKWKAISFIK